MAAGAGIGLVVESLQCIHRHDVRFVPLDGNPPTLGYALCHRPDLPDELRVSFVRVVSELAAEATWHRAARGALPA